MILGQLGTTAGWPPQSSANAARARLLLLPVAVRVKKRCLTAPFPSSIDADLLPEDPCAPGQNLHYRGQGESALIYSVGPDGKDDRGEIEYDAEYGYYGYDPGDLILKVK